MQGQRKKIKDITAIQLERIRLGKSVLVDESQQIHVRMNDPGTTSSNHPMGHQWTDAGDQEAQTAEKAMAAIDKEEGSYNL